MLNSPAAIVINRYCQTNLFILNFVQKLSDEQLHWQPATGNQSIAFHAWHIGRWADRSQATIAGMTPELGRRLPPGVDIWETEQLANRWGFNNVQLGWGNTGMQMPDEVAMRLPFPAKPVMMDYLAKVVALAERTVSAVDDEQFVRPEQLQPLSEGVWGQATVGDALVAHIVHGNRHLGMMECLLGLQGQAGTATI